jgi:hypothetical protein
MDNSTLTAEEQAYFDSRGETAAPAVEKEAAPAPEAIEEIEETDVGDADEGGDDVEQPRQSMVPHKALHAEREKRKALEKELQEHREYRIRLEERQRFLAEQDAKSAQTAANVEPEGIPDPDEDVFAASRYAIKETEAIKRQMAEQSKAIAEDRAKREIETRTQTLEAEFRAKVPDYDQAVQHAIQTRAKQLEVFGVKDPARRNEILRSEVWGIAQSAIRSGQSPAEVAYEYAKTLGYQPKALADAESGDERIERAKTASKTLSGVGGGPTAGVMTQERLLAMPMRDFEAYQKKHPATVRRLLGG